MLFLLSKKKSHTCGLNCNRSPLPQLYVGNLKHFGCSTSVSQHKSVSNLSWVNPACSLQRLPTTDLGCCEVFSGCGVFSVPAYLSAGQANSCLGWFRKERSFPEQGVRLDCILRSLLARVTIRKSGSSRTLSHLPPSQWQRLAGWGPGCSLVESWSCLAHHAALSPHLPVPLAPVILGLSF